METIDTSNTPKKARLLSIDLMRSLGILCIIFAHSYPPLWLAQIRNFGTPLLLIVAGLAASLSLANKPIEPVEFYKKRLARLVFPVWIFLTFFFLVTYVVFSVTHKSYPFDLETIVGSYMLYNGFGYVWVFKVFVVAALITPWAILYSKKVNNTNVYFVSILLLYVIYEVSLGFALDYRGQEFSEFTNTILLVVVPYSALFMYGLKMRALSHNTILLVAAISLGLFLVISYNLYLSEGEFVQTQLYKRPPRAYYLSYAFFCSNVIYLICTYLDRKYQIPKAFTWISNNTMWLYLWHIFGIAIWNILFDLPKWELGASLTKFSYLLVFASLATYIQIAIVSKYLKSHNSKAVRTFAKYVS